MRTSKVFLFVYTRSRVIEDGSTTVYEEHSVNFSPTYIYIEDWFKGNKKICEQTVSKRRNRRELKDLYYFF